MKERSSGKRPVARDILSGLFDAAVKAADPLRALERFLPAAPRGRTVVIGAGKGAAQMAAALETLWPEPLSGIVVTRYGYGCPTRAIEVIEASHPVPDEAGLRAGMKLLDTISGLSPDDLVIALICGGGSALLPAPPEGLTLADEIHLNEILLASGAPISAMNVVRKHFSTLKGGRLAAATKAKVVSLIVSDIPGDNAAQVASGPTVPDRSTRQEALEIVARYHLPLPAHMMAHLEKAVANAPSPDDPVFEHHEHHVIASACRSLEAAAEAGRKGGMTVHILSDSMEGEARDVALVHAALAREIALHDRPFTAPCILLSGGETTVRIEGKGGRGGRNGEFALAFAMAAEGLPVTLLAADTDGIDGTEDNAGAHADGETAQRLRNAGLDGRAMLACHDSYGAFKGAGDLFITGPTGVNVNDFRAILIERHEAFE